MLQSLEHVLMTVSDDLRFAETKNAALLTANAAAVIAIVQIFVSHPDLGPRITAYLLVLVVAGMVSGMLGLVSFIPRVRLRGPREDEVPEPTDNLLFYNHIRKYSGDTYLRAMVAAAGEAPHPPTALERMYADQIVAAARIADRKFELYRYSVWITIVGLTTPVIALLLWLFSHRPSLPGRPRATAVPPRPDTALPEQEAQPGVA